MATDTQTKTASAAALWTGRILSALVGVALIASGVVKLLIHFQVMPQPTPGPDAPDIQWPADVTLPLAIVEITCTLIYWFPRTSILGAILLTGYMGGAIAAHVRVHDYFFIQATIGVFVWLGIYLRCGRLRALVPFRT